METEKPITSIADIDAELAAEFGEAMKEDVAPPLDPETAKETTAVEPTKPEEPAVVETPTTEAETEPVKDKAGKAFADMRAKLKAAEEAFTKEASLLERLAKASGFSDVEAYKKALEDKIIEQEAKAKGVEPKVIKEIEERDAKIKALEAKDVERETQAKLHEFVQTIDKVVTEYGLDKVAGKQLIEQFEKDGYTLETLLAVPHYEYLIKGALSGQVLAKQTAVAEQKAKVDGMDTVAIPNSAVAAKSLDEMLDEEMKVYAKERNLRYK